MSITKRKFYGESQRLNKTLCQIAKQIGKILPKFYRWRDVCYIFKEYYKNEWIVLNERYELYSKKDKFLRSINKVSRYNPLPADVFIKQNSGFKRLMSEQYRAMHEKLFDEKTYVDALSEFREKRNVSVDKFLKKIENKNKIQQCVEPVFIDILIASYHSKGTTTQDKFEILKDISKYDCKKSIDFLYKINDAERNYQIRRIAFSILQNLGKYVVLRKNFKGKKKSYMVDAAEKELCPEDLYRKLNMGTIQSHKSYDFFISHSYLDREFVWSVVEVLNKNNYLCYCDWHGDSDYLKRERISEYTQFVLLKRVEQSKKVIFVKSENSISDFGEYKSPWIKFEIDCATKMNKAVIEIDKNCTQNVNDVASAVSR